MRKNSGYLRFSASGFLLEEALSQKRVIVVDPEELEQEINVQLQQQIGAELRRVRNHLVLFTSVAGFFYFVAAWVLITEGHPGWGVFFLGMWAVQVSWTAWIVWRLKADPRYICLSLVPDNVVKH